MNINRHNYEEFFILYLDNELSREDRASVELFVQENPDLQEEFDLLQQSSFAPDASLVFEGKEDLLRFAANDRVNMQNYEEWLLLYVDNELTAAQRSEVEQFAAAHPAVQQELALLQQTKLQPEDAIPFSFKQSLYRQEEKTETRVVTIRWWRLAAAAVVLAAVGIGGFYAFNNNGADSSEQGLAGATPSAIENPTKITPQQNPAETTVAIPEAPVMADNAKKQPAVPVVAPKNTGNTRQVQAPAPVQDNNPALAATNDKKANNNLPQPTYNPNMKEDVAPNRMLADNNMPSRRDLTDLKENNPTPRVTPDNADAYKLAGNQMNNEDEVADAGQPDKKNKFRGLLRKITRTFEKTTNIKATDEDDRLLVGSLAIRL